MAGFGELISLEYDVPHFSVRADYKVVVDFSNPKEGVIRLEDMDHTFKHALFGHYHDNIQWLFYDLYISNEGRAFKNPNERTSFIVFLMKNDRPALPHS